MLATDSHWLARVGSHLGKCLMWCKTGFLELDSVAVGPGSMWIDFGFGDWRIGSLEELVGIDLGFRVAMVRDWKQALGAPN